jgi:hypothetical protein
VDNSNNASGSGDGVVSTERFRDAAAVARARRLESLHRLAQAAQAAQPASQTTHPAPPPLTPSAPAPQSAHRRPRRRTRWIAAAAAVLCLAVVGGLVLRGLSSPTKQSAHPAVASGPVVLRTAFNDLVCVRDTAWAPNGTRIAVLGSLPADVDNCPTSSGLVNVYDTAGKISAHLQPDDAVRAALARTAGAPRDTPTITYTHVLWSFNGATLALTGRITYPDLPPNTTPAYSCLVLVDASGAHAHALVTRLANAVAVEGTLWDRTTGKATQLPNVSPVPGLASAFTPPSLTYMWGALGTPRPLQPLSAASAPSPGPLSPIASPTQDAEFTIWQPGQAELQVFPVRGAPPVYKSDATGVYTWTSRFAAWSPDGRYLLDDVSLAARIQPPGLPDASAQRIAELGLTGIPRLPLRDAGLGAVYKRMATGLVDASSQHFAIAWRPDGKVLAATPLVLQGDLFGGTPSVPPQPSVVTLYDCASGRALVTLPIPSSRITSPLDPSLLRWSMDGTHLLLSQASSDTLVIWGPGQLRP